MPSKRIKHNIVEGKPKTEAPPTIEGIETGEIARERSGMAPDQWNAAIRLQCAVRDALERPVKLVEAINFAVVLFRTGASMEGDEFNGIYWNDNVEWRTNLTKMRHQFDEARRLEQESKDAATEAEKKSAGQTK